MTSPQPTVEDKPSWLERLRAFAEVRGDEPVDALGVPYRVHYYVFAIFTTLLGGIPAVLSFTSVGEPYATLGARLICIGATLAGPGYVWLGARRDWRPDYPLFHVGMSTCVIGVSGAMFFMDGGSGATMLVLLVGAIGGAYHFPSKSAVPHIAAAVVALIATSFIATDEPHIHMRAAILAVVAVIGGVMTIAMKRHLIAIVTRNRELAELDALTGAANMRRFAQRAGAALAEMRRGGEPFSLIAIDLDGFKLVNDTHSHSTGDEMLIATSDAIAARLRPGDLLVRRGGDEFFVIAYDSRRRDLEGLAGELRASIERVRRGICPDLPAGAGAGVAPARKSDSIDTLIERADEALHANKASKRNAVISSEARGSSLDELRAEASGAAEREALGRVDEDPITGVAQIAWRAAAAAMLAIPTVILLADFTGFDPNFSLSAASLAMLATWMIVGAPAAWLISRRGESPESYRHGFAIVTIVAVAIGSLTMGTASLAAIESYMIVAIATMALLPLRVSVGYLVTILAIYLSFLLAYDYPWSTIRGTVTVRDTILLGVDIWFMRWVAIKAAKEKAELARTDALTGLANTRRLRDRLDDEVARCRAGGRKLTLLMIDLDEFKSVNDRFSHTLGDKVLVATADAIRDSARHSDMACRRGGDEFAVILANAGEREALLSAERIATAIRAARATVCPDVNATASAGWVEWQPGMDTDDLIEAADAALHDVKAARRVHAEKRAEIFS